MIFRVLEDKKLNKIITPSSLTEDQFIGLQKSKVYKFIKVDESDLPKQYEDDKRKFNEIFYMLDENDNIVIDYERTEQAWLDERKKELTHMIYTNYPQSKQNSDIADKMYYETLLRSLEDENHNKIYPTLDNMISTMVVQFYHGKTIDELLNSINEKDKESFEQLLKVGIRVKWIQDCKNELKQALKEKREPQYPLYPFN